MSISNRNTSIQKPQSSNKPNYIRPTGPPNFSSQELYNIESNHSNSDIKSEYPFSADNYENYDCNNLDSDYQETAEHYLPSQCFESCYKSDDTDECYRENVDVNNSHDIPPDISNFIQGSTTINAT